MVAELVPPLAALCAAWKCGRDWKGRPHSFYHPKSPGDVKRTRRGRASVQSLVSQCPLPSPFVSGGETEAQSGPALQALPLTSEVVRLRLSYLKKRRSFSDFPPFLGFSPPCCLNHSGSWVCGLLALRAQKTEEGDKGQITLKQEHWEETGFACLSLWFALQKQHSCVF